MAHLSPANVDDIMNSVLPQPAWVAAENPQLYDERQYAYASHQPKRHILGLVGGNEVSIVKGNVTDVESDLTRRTRPLTRCAPFLHTPIGENDTQIKRQNRKYDLTLDITKNNLPACQMWAYPTVMAPAPLKNDPCLTPHKY